MKKIITEQMLDALRDSLTGEMSEKRLKHTLEVEKMVVRLAKLYCPEKELMLRGAALLHDITKEYKSEWQIAVCARYGLGIGVTDVNAPKTLHARTAAALIPDKYPEFADDELISCVRWHTTGREGMTLCEKLVYLADYIDMSRKFADCVVLREHFFSKEPESMTMEERLIHLDETLILSYDMGLRGLLEENAPISEDTVRARNELVISFRNKS